MSSLIVMNGSEGVGKISSRLSIVVEETSSGLPTHLFGQMKGGGYRMRIRFEGSMAATSNDHPYVAFANAS